MKKRGYRMQILLTSRNHAGENPGKELDHREAGLPPPLQMCDVLDRNDPKEHETNLCHGNVLLRRQFVDIRTRFPEECAQVVETLAEVHRVEIQCRKDKVDAEKRLRHKLTYPNPRLSRSDRDTPSP